MRKANLKTPPADGLRHWLGISIIQPLIVLSAILFFLFFPAQSAFAGSIVAWGDNTYRQCNVPSPNTGFAAVAAGGCHSLGLKADGSVVAWGEYVFGQCDVPSPNTGFVALAAGWLHSLGLKADGSVVAWGDNSNGQCNVPSPNTGFVVVTAGDWYSLGLKANGSVVSWGSNISGLPSPNTGFVAVSAGYWHSLGLKIDGSIVAWGVNLPYGQCNVPSPNTGFVAVAAGRFHSLGLKADGSIVAWGRNYEGQCSIPAPNTGFVAVAASLDHSLGLKADGSIVAWGDNCNVPSPNTGFVAIAAGYYHSLAIRSAIPASPTASFTYSPERPMVGGNIIFDASASYDPDGQIVSYQWDFGDSNSAEGQVVTHTYTKPGEYTVTLTVTDDDGLTGTALSTLKVKGKKFMITFDDGPIFGATEEVIKELEHPDFYVEGKPVKAGFFMVGDNDIRYHSWYEWWTVKGRVKEYHDIARKVAEADHWVGNHTQHHAAFSKWWLFGYSCMGDFVKEEISQCNGAIAEAISTTPPKIFRSPYLYDEKNPEIRPAVEGLGFKIIGGNLVGDSSPFASLEMVKKTALQILKSWDKDEPAVLIFHPEPMDVYGNHPVTYGHIGEIIRFLQKEGFTLVHFDPSRIPEQINWNTPKQALSGVAHSPVDLRITDPDGLILSKEENQIPDALYEEIDIDEDGELDDFFIIPESKAGCYSVEVIPETNALPEDTYSLEVAHGERVVVLAENARVDAIPPVPYSVVFTEDADLDNDSRVNFTDFSLLAAHWRNSDCNQVNNWCNGSDLDASGSVDIHDLARWADHWLEVVLLPIPADFNGDGKVDLDDLKILAEQWLQSPGGLSADIAPTPADGIVNFLDYAVLAEHWLEQR
jgi:PKD repeat protein